MMKLVMQFQENYLSLGSVFMFIKIFVLGRPGSGKSTVVRRMVELAECRNYPVICVKDYDILYQMFQNDGNRGQFRAADYGGFDVLDTIVFDDALKLLENIVCEMSVPEETTLMTIEFARDDYSTAFKLFSSEFLRDAYIFFVEADLKSCIKRIHKRVITPSEPDHHFVSDYIMETYYNQDNWIYVSSSLMQEYPDCKEIVAIRNTNSLLNLLDKVSEFIEGIFKSEFSNEQSDKARKYNLQAV